VPVLLGGPTRAEELALLEPIAPDYRPREVETEALYLRLTHEGLGGAEAAGVIGYMVGLAQGDSRWSLAQINQLLFLRDLYVRTPWGETERASA
jgi:hypothetical protein